MKMLLKIVAVAMFVSAGLVSCQTDQADRNHYDASAKGTPGVETQAEKDELSPPVELPADTTAATKISGNTSDLAE